MFLVATIHYVSVMSCFIVLSEYKFECLGIFSSPEYKNSVSQENKRKNSFIIKVNVIGNWTHPLVLIVKSYCV